MKEIIEADNEIKEEILKKFTPKREASELLSASYGRLGYDSKSERVKGCGTFLEFRQPVSDNAEKWRLHSANFCRDRLCPLCSMRRTYKIFGQISQIMDVIEDKYAFIFLTLTVVSFSAEKENRQCGSAVHTASAEAVSPSESARSRLQGGIPPPSP